MIELARGYEQVSAIEAALGGPPEADEMARAREEMARVIEVELRAHEARWAENAEASRGLRELTLSRLAGDGPELTELLTANARLAEQRRPVLVKPPEEPAIEPQLAVGSIQLTKSPPYDEQIFEHSGGGQSSAIASAANGRYDLHAKSVGQGTAAVAGSLGLHFRAPFSNPSQRVAVSISASWSWWQQAAGYVAHSNGNTTLNVFGLSENRWMVRGPIEPGWSNGVAWYENHSDSHEPENLSGEAFFPATAGNTYVAWLTTIATADADGGAFGSASSELSFGMFARFFVFGSL